jgi:exodeoxyribonuclease VII small subunit
MSQTDRPDADGSLDHERPYEQIVDRLEEVVEQLERGELPLERSLELFEEGVKLSREASGRLDAAERRIEELLEDGSLVPLDVSGHETESEG